MTTRSATLGLVAGALLCAQVQIATARPNECTGDCNGDANVAVDDIVALVGIALGEPLDGCRAGDGNGDGQITVDDILAAVSNALSGCPIGCASLSAPLALSAPTSVRLSSTSGTPATLVVADFNHDGNPDLAVGKTSEWKGPVPISILLGDGRGGLTQLGDEPTAGVWPYYLASADFNEDGNSDLVTHGDPTDVRGCPGSTSGALLLADGTGRFSVNNEAFCVRSLYWVATGDFNRDGHADLALTEVAATWTRDPVATKIFLGDGMGRLSLDRWLPNLSGLATGDFNRDGYTDVVLVPRDCHGCPEALHIRGRNANDHSEVLGRVLAPEGESFLEVAVGDLNGDDYDDLVVSSTRYTPQGNAYHIHSFLGDGRGAFREASTLTRTMPAPLLVGDVNRDGRPDVVTVAGGRTVAIFGDGRGGLCGAEHDVGSSSWSPVLADMNHDGLLDVVTVSGWEISVRLGTR